ncbi:MAG: response regulator [Gemmatirosa sp.]
MSAPRLLVVEDNPDIAEGLEANLESEGFAVELARDGRLALAAVQQARPDLIVLDLGLPRMDGREVLERLRADGVWCPVLILSARGSEMDKLDGFRLGADDYVTKPFGMRELVARISALLRRTTPAPAAAPAAASSAASGGSSPSDAELLARFGLTDRQSEVARLLSEGLSNDELAQRLGISPHTARNHTEHVMRKLGANSRARVGAVLRAAVH